MIKTDVTAESLPKRRVVMVAGRLAVPPSYFVFSPRVVLSDRYEFTYLAQIVNVSDEFQSFMAGWDNGRHPAHAVSRAIVKSRAHVVHQHWATWSGPARRAARRLRVPFVLSVHGYDAFLPRTPGLRGPVVDVLKRFDRWRALRSADAIVVNSEYMRSVVKDLGVSEDKLVLIRHGVDLQRYSPPDAAVRRNGIVFVGRLSEEKGCHVLLEALALIPLQERPELTVIGDGPESSRLRRLASELDLRVVFRGKQNAAVVVESMRTARIVVVPSVARGRQHEASGIVPLEALACGTLAIVTKVGGLPENVPDQFAALICEPTPLDMANAIARGLEMDVGSVADAARAHVEQFHSIERYAAEFDSLYRSLLDR